MEQACQDRKMTKLEEMISTSGSTNSALNQVENAIDEINAMLFGEASKELGFSG